MIKDAETVCKDVLDNIIAPTLDASKEEIWKLIEAGEWVKVAYCAQSLQQMWDNVFNFINQSLGQDEILAANREVMEKGCSWHPEFEKMQVERMRERLVWDLVGKMERWLENGENS